MLWGDNVALFVLVILHGLISIALIGAVTHQGLGVWRRVAPARSFFERFRAVGGAGYANAVVVLYLVTFLFGAYVYPAYVLGVKASLADNGETNMIFIFQVKEHIAVLGLVLLPGYWYLWRSVSLTEQVAVRRFVTTILMLSVWWNLVVGHILNNVRGLS
jgi:hypothetical protein